VSFKVSFSFAETPLPLAMLIATGILRTRHKHSSVTTLQEGGRRAEKGFLINVASCPIIFGLDCPKMCFRIKGIYNSTIKEDMFHMFTHGCAHSPNVDSIENVFNFVKFLLEDEATALNITKECFEELKQ